MAFAEALSDGSLTGRGAPVVRGAVTGGMTAIGGLGHALPYLIPDFFVATALAFVVVAIELAAFSWIRMRYMDTPFLQAAFQVVVGGVLVFAAGILPAPRPSRVSSRRNVQTRHTSDWYIASQPRAAELVSKRGLGFINWHRKRKYVHRPGHPRDRSRSESSTPDHIAVTGDLVNGSPTSTTGHAAGCKRSERQTT